jgi:hypothetical protein
MRNRIDHAPSACSSAATPSRINVAADATRIPSIECSDHTLDARIEMRFRPQANTPKFLAPHMSRWRRADRLCFGATSNR